MTQRNLTNALTNAATHNPAPRKPKLQLDERSPAVVDRFVIRLPNGLRDQIRALSEQNHRSMNAEIIMVLEKHIRQKFLQQMQEANTTGPRAITGQQEQASHLEDELSRRLESLPPGKKEALLELLG